jgi:hypothetical protein
MQSQLDAILSSTFYSPEYSPNQLMRSYELLYPDGSTEDHLDLADWNYRAIIRSITKYSPIKWNTTKKFTTLMYETYGNTTCYRIVLTFNGFMHPYEIDEGAIVYLPDPEELSGLITQQQIKKKNSPIQDVVI